MTMASQYGDDDAQPSPMSTTPDLERAAALFRALGDPTRLRILQHLALGPHRVRDLTDHLGLAQSTVSVHVACLRECGLVTARPYGRATLHSLARHDLLAGLLGRAEDVLTETGDGATRCRLLGGPDDASPP